MSKFFKETNGGKYDKRFFVKDVPKDIKHQILRKLLAVLVKLYPTIIIMHGTLMGWYFNSKILPWDDDIDVCVFYSEMEDMVTTESETILLEINPNYTNRSTKNKTFRESREPNKIDARVICKKTGVFIDITALCKNGDQFSTKCPHHFKEHDILPLKPSIFEGVPVFVPNMVDSILKQEYGNKFIEQKSKEVPYNGYVFSTEWKRV